MTTYSALFSSGLLAPCMTRPSTPTKCSHTLPSPVDPIDRELSITPLLSPITLRPKTPRVGAPGERSRMMRRRRSSMNVAASPMAAIKSPSRNATSALHRTGIMSPSRSRAGSVNEASENNSLFGRVPPIRARRAVRRTVPIAPPPTIPLPAIPPPFPTSRCTNTMLLPAPRQPPSARPPLSDNSATLVNSEYAPKTPTSVLPSRASSPAIPIPIPDYFEDVDMNENQKGFQY